MGASVLVPSNTVEGDVVPGGIYANNKMLMPSAIVGLYQRPRYMLDTLYA